MYDKITVWEKAELGFRAEVNADDGPNDPREWDNLGTMVCSHSRYDLGDRQHDGRGYAFEEWIDEVLEGVEDPIWLPLYLLDHSGISMSYGSAQFRAVDSHGWDWGPVGIIYVSERDLPAAYMVEEVTDEIRERAVECLKGEVETYDQCLRGDVYYYVVESEDGTVLDSCGGFFGEEVAIEEADGVLAHHVKAKLARQRQWIMDVSGLGMVAP